MGETMDAERSAGMTISPRLIAAGVIVGSVFPWLRPKKKG